MSSLPFAFLDLLQSLRRVDRRGFAADGPLFFLIRGFISPSPTSVRPPPGFVSHRVFPSRPSLGILSSHVAHRFRSTSSIFSPFPPFFSMHGDVSFRLACFDESLFLLFPHTWRGDRDPCVLVANWCGFFPLSFFAPSLTLIRMAASPFGPNFSFPKSWASRARARNFF